MKIRTWLPLVMLALAAACSDSGLTGPDPAAPTSLDPSAGPEVAQPAAPPAVAHFSVAPAGDGDGPTVTTDKEDYQPGDTVTISGSGWWPEETVELRLDEDPATHDPLVFSSVADENGDFVNRDFVVEEHDLGVTFTLTATGLTSGLTAGGVFTDAAVNSNFSSFTLNGGTSPLTVAPGAALNWAASATCANGSGPTNTCVAAGTTAGGAVQDGYEVLIQHHTSTTFTPANTVVQDASGTTTSGSVSGSFNAPSTAGTYYFRARHGAQEIQGSPNNNWGAATSSQITVTVQVPANQAPVLTVPSDFSTQWGVALSGVQATANDPNVGDVLTFSLVSAPTGMTINSSTGVISWTPTASQVGGPYTVTVKVEDNGSPVMSDQESFHITVTTRPTSLSYDGSQAGQYSDKSSLSATLTDNGDGSMNGDPIVGETVTFTFDAGVTNLAAGSDATDSNGQAAVLYQIPKPDGDYDVKADFAGGSGYASSSTTVSFDVDPEDAMVDVVDNPGTVGVQNPGGVSVAFNIKVRVQEDTNPSPEPDENDGAMPGDISNANVTMTLTPFMGGSPTNGSCADAVTGTPPSYAAYQVFTCDFSGLAVNTYIVDVMVTGGYYDGSTDDVLTVSDPSLGFVTGGGKFVLGTDRVSFGFSVTNTKGKTVQRGGLVVVRHHADGGRCRAKSKDVSVAISTNGMTATLSSNKSTNYSCVDGNGAPTDGKGNLNLIAYVEDNGEPGTGVDKFLVNVGYGELQMSGPATLTGGNIQVPHKAK